MKKKPAVKSSVLAMDVITKLTQPDRIQRFADLSKVAQSAFAGLGKLLFAISADLKPKETIYSVLRAAGLKDGTISNASYASKAWELVIDGTITEAEYDSFGFRDSLAIVRVLGPKSAKRLAKEDVAVIIRSVADFEPELRSIYEHGVTLEEKAANDKLIAEAQAESDKADAKVAAAAAKPAPAAATAAATEPETAPATAAPAVANAATAEAPAPEAGKVVAMPASKPTADTMNRLLDTFEEQFLELAPEDQILIGGRFLAIAETIFSFKDTVTPAAVAA